MCLKDSDVLHMQTSHAKPSESISHKLDSLLRSVKRLCVCDGSIVLFAWHGLIEVE